MAKKLKALRIFDYVIISLFLLFSILFLTPILVVFSGAFSSETQLMIKGYSIIPRAFTFDAFNFIFITAFDDMVPSILYSFYITIMGVIISTVISSLCAYTLSIGNLPYKKAITMFCIIPMYFAAGLVPNCIVFSKMQLIDTHELLILIGLVNPFGLLMLRNAFKQVPQSLYESARLDGASEFVILFKIALPLVKAMITVVAMMIAITYWNDWMNAMYYLTSTEKQPLQLLIYRLMQRASDIGDGGNIGMDTTPVQSLKMALVVIAIAPVLVIYPFIQRYFIGGYITGAVKE